MRRAKKSRAFSPIEDCTPQRREGQEELGGGSLVYLTPLEGIEIQDSSDDEGLN